VPADEIEEIIARALRDRLTSSGRWSPTLWEHDAVATYVAKMEIHTKELAIAVRQKCSVRQINLTLSMSFLAPFLVRAAIEGRLPRGIGIAELRDAAAEWLKQYLKLGLPRQ
jgi:hypothetical protein